MKRSILILSIIMSVLISTMTPMNVVAKTDLPWDFTGPANEVPLVDSAKMSDETFFGKWTDGSWEIVGKLNYDYVDEENPDIQPLKPMEEFVKAGDYESAKKELLSYCRNRDYEKLSLGNRNKLQSDLALDWIFSYNDRPLTVFPVTGDSYTEISLDVTTHVQGQVQDFMLFARDKAETTAYFQTRESEHPPTLEVVVNGATRTYTAVSDLYTLFGARTTNFGSEPEMLVRDSGGETASEPLDENASRSYFRFSIFDNEDPSLIIGENDIITSATLKLYARTDDPSGTKNIILYNPESKNIPETSIYNNIAINTLSWNGMPGGTDWANYYNRGYNAHSEFANVQTRLTFLAPMLAEYNETMDERYIKGVFGLIADFAYDRNGPGWIRQLEVAERGNQFYVIYPYLLESEYMNPDIHTAIVKMLWEEANYLYQDENFRPDGNWGVWDTQGFLKVCALFPEFSNVSNDTWVPKISQRIDVLMNNTVLDDGSYIESSMGYALAVHLKFYEFMELTEKIGITLSDDFYEKFAAFTMYFIDMSAVNGEMQSFGDGGGGIILDEIDKTADLYRQMDDPALVEYGEQFKYFSSQGKEGKLIDHTSTFYKTGQIAVMRDSWDENGQFVFINGGHDGGHNHKDELAFHLTAYGRPLIKDTGAPSYDPNNPNVDFIRYQSRSHNVVEIDDRAPVDALAYKGQTTSSMRSNNFFDFFEGETRLNRIDDENLFDTRRKVLNIKPYGFYIISDYIVPPDEEEHKYTQNWHMDPYTAVLKDDGTNRFASSFSTGANVQLVPGDAQSVTPEFREGLGFDGWNGTQRNDRYPAYTIRKSGAANFDTIIFPIAPGEQREIITSQISMDVPSTTATAVKIDMDYPQKGDFGYYYLSYEETPSLRTFDKYQTDAEMAFVGTNNTGMEITASLQNGKTLNLIGADNRAQCLISSDKIMSNLGIYIYGNTLEVSSSSELDALGTLTIRSNGQISKVLFNGEEVRYAESGDNIIVGGNNFWVPVTLNSVTNRNEGYVGTNGVEKRIDNIKLSVQPFSKLTGSSDWSGVIWIFPETAGKKTELAFGSENEAVLSDKVVKIEVDEEDVSLVSYVKDGKSTELRTVDYETAAEAESDLLYNEAAVTITDDGAVIWTKIMTDFTISYDAVKDPNDEDDNDESSSSRPSGNRPSGGNGGGTGGGTVINPTDPTDPTTPTDPTDPTTPTDPSNDSIQFTDIENHWAKAEIEELTRLGIISNDTEFRPDDEIKRSELVSLVVRALDVPMEKYQNEFNDVSSKHWASDSIKTGVTMGLVSGYDGSFRPDDAIMREEMAKILVLAYQYKNDAEIEQQEHHFTDEAQISEWARQYVGDATSIGLVNGLDDGSFGPQQKATRAQAAVIISRLLEAIK